MRTVANGHPQHPQHPPACDLPSLAIERLSQWPRKVAGARCAASGESGIAATPSWASPLLLSAATTKAYPTSSDAVWPACGGSALRRDFLSQVRCRAHLEECFEVCFKHRDLLIPDSVFPHSAVTESGSTVTARTTSDKTLKMSSKMDGGNSPHSFAASSSCSSSFLRVLCSTRRAAVAQQTSERLTSLGERQVRS